MSEQTPNLIPLRHGNWHVIDGQLVDLDEQKPDKPAVPEPTNPVEELDQSSDSSED